MYLAIMLDSSAKRFRAPRLSTRSIDGSHACRLATGSAEAHRGEQQAAPGWRSTRCAPVLAAELGIPKIWAVEQASTGSCTIGDAHGGVQLRNEADRGPGDCRNRRLRRAARLLHLVYQQQ